MNNSSLQNLKHKVYNLIRSDDENDLNSTIIDGMIIVLIIINVILVILDTFDFPPHVKRWFYILEIVSVMLFTVEYFLRVWTATHIYPHLSPVKARLKYVCSAMAIIDLLAILPFYLPFIFPIDLRVLRIVRIFRLLRIFKVNRYTDALSSVMAVFKKKASQLISSMFIVFVLMIISSVLMYSIEHEAQPDVFKNAFSGIWWAIVTLTTVGYGDIVPITVMGQLLGGLIALLGIGLVAVPTGIISSGFMEQLNEEKEKKQSDSLKCYCPYCGGKID